MAKHDDPFDDPLKDDPIGDVADDDPERPERIRKLRERIADATDGRMSFSENDPIDPALQEAFLENVALLEESGWTAPIDQLLEAGLEIVPAGELDDEALSRKLREVILAMSMRNMFVHHTDHLSDRELYAFLLETLRENSFMGPAEPRAGFNFVIDVLGGCSEEDIEKSFRYYTHDDEERRHWMEQFPDYVMPPKEKPPYSRDCFLPKPNYSTPFEPDDVDLPS